MIRYINSVAIIVPYIRFIMFGSPVGKYVIDFAAAVELTEIVKCCFQSGSCICERVTVKRQSIFNSLRCRLGIHVTCKNNTEPPVIIVAFNNIQYLRHTATRAFFTDMIRCVIIKTKGKTRSQFLYKLLKEWTWTLASKRVGMYKRVVTASTDSIEPGGKYRFESTQLIRHQIRIAPVSDYGIIISVFSIITLHMRKCFWNPIISGFFFFMRVCARQTCAQNLLRYRISNYTLLLLILFIIHRYIFLYIIY